MDPHVAAWEGDLETLRLLLSEDANVVHARDEEEFGDGNTPLHYAAYQGHLAIARLLLDGGARINEENKCVRFPPQPFAENEAASLLLPHFLSEAVVLRSSMLASKVNLRWSICFWIAVAAPRSAKAGWA